jgi:hypothetical protein
MHNAPCYRLRIFILCRTLVWIWTEVLAVSGRTGPMQLIRAIKLSCYFRFVVFSKRTYLNPGWIDMYYDLDENFLKLLIRTFHRTFHCDLIFMLFFVVFCCFSNWISLKSGLQFARSIRTFFYFFFSFPSIDICTCIYLCTHYWVLC